jgi:hypothetical protein
MITELEYRENMVDNCSVHGLSDGLLQTAIKINFLLKLIDTNFKVGQIGIDYCVLKYNNPGLSLTEASKILALSPKTLRKIYGNVLSVFKATGEPSLVFNMCSLRPSMPKSRRLNTDENNYLAELVYNDAKFTIRNCVNSTTKSINKKLNVPDILSAMKFVLSEKNKLKSLHEIFFNLDKLTIGNMSLEEITKLNRDLIGKDWVVSISNRSIPLCSL